MPRRVDVVLGEVLVAIDGVEDALAGRTKATFIKNWFLQRGTERPHLLPQGQRRT
jgi:hypothetical protein